MSSHKSIDRICIIITAFTIIIALVFCGFVSVSSSTVHAIGYENRIFDRSKVHTIDIVMNNWDSFIESCESEEYSPCNLVIDGEAVKNVGIRAKGNTSLSSVKNMNSSRYSFKIEFDQYDKTKSYQGLDKLCLNNIIQDNTYMKDYLAYTLMYDFGVDSPLCSYAYITVNGEDWGLYLAVEAIENSFLTRNYGSNYGDLYKPDSMSFGGGRGNGKEFNMTEFMNENADSSSSSEENSNNSENENKSSRSGNGFSPPQGFGGNMPDNIDFSNFDPSQIPEMSGFNPSDISGDKQMPDMGGFGGFGGGMGSDDVKLKYIDDDADSYSNIFNNAKTTVNTADKNRLIRSLKSLSEKSDLESVLDTEEVLRYFVVHNFLCNGDSYTGMMIHNYYLYENNGQLSMIPWDYNLAYGSFSGGDASSSVNSPIDTPVSGDMSDRPMLGWIFDSEEYTKQYNELFSEFLSKVDFGTLVSETAALIDKYVEKDPTKFCTYEEYQKGVTAIKSFCELRAESVKGQLEGTIPNTTDGQKSDSSALIDTSSLNISDMGTMGSGGGFGGFGGSKERPDADSDYIENPDKKTTSSGASNRPSMQPPGGGQMTEGFSGQMPEGFDPSQIPEGFSGQMPGNTESSTDQDKKPDETSSNTSDAVGSNSQKNGQTSNSKSQRPSMDGFPGMSSGTKSNDMTAFILIGISAFVLILGIIVAKVYKR